jgi:hypothetical protein
MERGGHAATTTDWSPLKGQEKRMKHQNILIEMPRRQLIIGARNWQSAALDPCQRAARPKALKYNKFHFNPRGGGGA